MCTSSGKLRQKSSTPCRRRLRHPRSRPQCACRTPLPTARRGESRAPRRARHDQANRQTGFCQGAGGEQRREEELTQKAL
eukprot:8966094-Alexandrium_andersonii.AAC.1